MSEGLMSGGGGKEFKYPGDLLWTNPTPSTFAAQTLTLDTSKYDVLNIIVKGSSNTSNYISKNDTQKQIYVYANYQDGIDSSMKRNYSITDTAITFGIGISRDNYSYSTNYCVPYQIYGVVKK